MPLITIKELTAGFGGPPLLENASLNIDAGERIALVGRNGTGKSTLLSLIDGGLQADSGSIQIASDVTVAKLIQTVPAEMHGTIFSVVSEGLGPIGEVLARYHELSAQESGVDETLRAQLEEQIQEADAWSYLHQVEKVVTKLGLDPNADISPMSAGVRRRALFGRSLVLNPDVLLLDEPTNHLDVASIEWLESFLASFNGAILFVTHDRFFLQAVATRIVDLDRGRLVSYECGWSKYLERKQHELEVEEEKNKEFDRKLAQEEIWIRKGVKERRKRNMGRVRELEQLRRERRARRDKVGSVRMLAQEAKRTGRLVVDIEDLAFAFGEFKIVQRFSATIQRGDRIGLLGPNGVGKTTLLRLLLKELEPDAGSIRHGTHLEIAYFDQLHSVLEEEKTVQENVTENGSDKILIDGKPRHIIGYLEDFLFSPAESRSRVNTLSGGQRNRLLLARLFARPSNVLVLDEPTNDLDTETLDLLEDLVAGYKGTVLVVSHDRAFLDNVATSTFAFEGNGRVKEYVGGYSDWIRQRQVDEPAQKPKKAAKPSRPDPEDTGPEDAGPKRLSYKERKELEQLPAKLESLEARKQEILDAMQEPGFYEQDHSITDKATRNLREAEEELATAYTRWEGLEERADL